MSEQTNQTFSGYIKQNKGSLALGATISAIAAILTILSLIVGIVYNYEKLDLTVQANALTTHSLEMQLQNGQMTENNNISRIIQQEHDQQGQLDNVSGQVNSIYQYFFDKIK